MILVEARPDRHVELARMTAFNGKTLESPGLCHTLSVSAHGQRGRLLRAGACKRARAARGTPGLSPAGYKKIQNAHAIPFGSVLEERSVHPTSPEIRRKRSSAT